MSFLIGNDEERGFHEDDWMTLFTAFRSPSRRVALAFCSLAIVALASPASAKPRHHAHRHVHHHARHVAVMPTESAVSQNTASFGGSSLVAEARRYIGGNPTGRGRLWCARFMNMVLERSGHRGTGSDMARSFAGYGQRISGPQIGAIAVMSRGRRGGHVGVVSGIDPNGNPIVISGNHGRRVAESTYSRGRIYAYVMPTS